MGKLRKNIKGFECPKCRCYLGQSRRTVATHYSRVHADARFEGRNVHPRQFEAWFSLSLRDDEYGRLEGRLVDDEREFLERQEAVHDALQEARHEPVMPPEREANEERDRRRAREDALRRRRQADSLIEELLTNARRTLTQNLEVPRGEVETLSSSEETVHHPRPIPEMMGRARQWIEQCEAEEKKLETLPALWGKRLRKASLDIQNLFRPEVTAIVDEAKRWMDETTVPDPEDRWTIFEGALAEINMKLRSGVRRITRAPRAENRPVRIRRNISTVVMSAKKLIDMTRRLYESKQMSRTQSRQTAESQLTEQITHAMEQIEGIEQMVTVLGTGEIDIRGLIEDDREHFEARMRYLEDSLKCYEREARGQESNGYRSIIQSMCNEDPNRVLKHHVFKDNYDECPLTVDQLVSTYGETAARPERYEELLLSYPFHLALRAVQRPCSSLMVYIY